MPTPEEILAYKLRQYPEHTNMATIPEVSGRPNIGALYERLAAMQGKSPDYTNVEEVANARRGQGQRDFLAGLVLSGMGGESARPLGQALAAQGIETGKPLRANAADVGYYNPDTGKFVENPLAKQQREDKAIQSRIDALTKEQESQARIALAQQTAQDRSTQMSNADQNRQLMTAIAGQNATTNAMLASARADWMKARAAGAGGGAGGGTKRLQLGEQRDLVTAVTSAQNLARLEETFKDSYAGGTAGTAGADVQNYLARNFPKAMESTLGKDEVAAMREQAEFWANQKYYDELPERHEIFGATLTGPERTSWKSAAIQPGMLAEDIKRNLALRRDLAERAVRRAELLHLENNVLPNAVFAITGGITGSKDSKAVKAAGPSGVVSPSTKPITVEDAMRLYGPK